MRYLLAALSLAATTNLAHADNCGPRNASLIELKDWSATKSDFGSVNVSMSLQSHAEKPIRMLKASVIFSDPFGDNVANLALDPDVAIPAKATYTEKGSWSAARLAKVRPQDVSALVCVSAVLYEDGSKEQFQ
jgi:hypothetical protein